MPRIHHTFCRICEAACGLTVHVDENRIEKIVPDDEHVVSKGYACIKGLSLDKFVESPDRITRPLKREGDRFIEISWQQALSEIGERLATIRKTHGGESLAAYTGNPIGFSLWPNTVMQGFLQGFGSDKLFTAGTADCTNKFAVADRMYGSFIRQTFPDVDHTKFLVVIGSNPVVSKMSFINLPHPMDRLQAIEERGGQVVWVNPRKTESSKRFGDYLAIKPDSDVFFMLAFLNEVIARGAVQTDRVQAHMDGYEQLPPLVSEWTAERVAPVTGIDAATMRDLVDRYLAADGAALYSSTGINQGRFGTLAYWLQECINALTGNLDRRGGTLMGKPVVEVPDNTQEEKFSRIANTPYITGMLPSGILADEILEPGEGQVKALFVMSGNPLRTCANSERLEKAFDSLELLVSTDLYRNETGNRADYILPGSHFLERADIPFMFLVGKGLLPDRYFHYTDPVLVPPGEARDEGLILRQIARHAGFPMFGSRLVQWAFDIGERLGRWFPSLETAESRFYALLMRRSGLGGLREQRQFRRGQLQAPNQPGDYFGQRLAEQGHRVQLAPAEFVGRCASLGDVFERELKNTQLKLISKRERFSHNSWAHNLAGFVKGDRNTNYLYIHSEDASRLSLREGELAEVSANDRAIRVPVKIDDDFMPGTVSVPHGWGHQEADGLTIAKTTQGANVNIIARDGPDSVEPVSGMSQFNGIPVEIRPVA